MRFRARIPSEDRADREDRMGDKRGANRAWPLWRNRGRQGARPPGAPRRSGDSLLKFPAGTLYIKPPKRGSGCS